MAIPNAATRVPVRGLLIGMATALFCPHAGAEPLRLEQRIAPACVAAASELGPRIERTLDGFLPAELGAWVAIDALRAGYRVIITLRDSEQTRGTTVIEAPTCEEAVDAAAVVLALAFGNMKRAEAMDPASSSLPPQRAGSRPSGSSRPSASRGSLAEPVVTPSNARPAHVDRRAPLSSAPVRGLPRGTRLTLATGADRGTLPHPTLTLAAAVARSFGGLELAAVARYGLPIAEETVESGFSESQRRDFGSLELRVCRGLGQAVRFSTCAGTEVGAVRARHAFRVEDRADLQNEHVSPRLSGTVAVLVARRGGLVEPGVELAGAAAAYGREAGAPWLSVRIAASAAIAF
jgi:hypothetical protein